MGLTIAIVGLFGFLYGIFTLKTNRADNIDRIVGGAGGDGHNW